MSADLGKSEGLRAKCMTGETVVLSDPARLDDFDGRTRPASDSVTFWADSSYDGLVAAAARFKRHSFRPHTHSGLMIGLIDAGTKFFRRERAPFLAGKGSISIVNAGDLHTGSRADGDELRYRALYIPISVLAEAAGSSTADKAPGFRSGVVQDERLFIALGRLHVSIVDRASRLAREHFLLESVQSLVDNYGSSWKQRDKSIANAPGSVRAAYAIIESHFREDLSVSCIATAVEVSPYHLMRQFQHYIGIPMHAFQTQLRVNLGKRLLQEGMPASEVALEVGFADQSHFSKRFKQLVGTSPVSYQRNMQRIRARR